MRKGPCNDVHTPVDTCIYTPEIPGCVCPCFNKQTSKTVQPVMLVSL